MKNHLSLERRLTVLASVLAGGALGAGAVPAAAQEDVTTARAGAGEIGEIIVSARRRDETLQNTPLAITALAPSQLESKATLNIGDLMGAAPNVLITHQNTGASAANVSIRGLAFADVDKSFESTIGMVVDGVFIGTSTGAFLDFFDIESIEVLRGPQGTLFGRNTIGGVINIQRTRPTGEWGGRFEASYGRFDTLAARAVVNVPVVSDVLAAKFFYFHNESDGYYRHGITGARVGGSNNENFGAAFLFTPTDNFDALLTLEKQVQSFDPVNSSRSKTGELFCLFAPPGQCNRDGTGDLYTVFTEKGTSDYEAPAATLEMNLNLDGVQLTSITGYRESDEDQRQDLDATTADLYLSHRVQNFRQFSQEVRASGDVVAGLDYVVGAFFYDHKYTLDQKTRFMGAVDPAANQLTVGKSKSFALFGDFNWAFADQWRLSFGGRWTRDKKHNQLRLGDVQFPEASYSGSKFTPKLGVDYRPTDDVMIYAGWSRGYRSGGFSGRGLSEYSSTTPYGPETVDSFEIGFKSSWFDRRLQLNVAAFYADYRDMQQNTTIPTAGGLGNETIVTNVGGATIKGIEADLTARLTDELTISGSVGLLDSGFKNFVSQGAISALAPGLRTIDYSNVNMIYAPKVTAAINAEYAATVPFGEWVTTVGYRYLSPYDQQVALDATAAYPPTGPIVLERNDPRVRTDRQNLLDASTSLRFDLGGNQARVTVYGRNLLDDRGPNATFTVAGLWSFASGREPRTFGVQFGYEF